MNTKTKTTTTTIQSLKKTFLVLKSVFIQNVYNSSKKVSHQNVTLFAVHFIEPKLFLFS